MQSSKRIAILITTYNRKETVLNCLKCIYKQDLKYNLEIDIYLLIDGSTDSTAEEVSKKYPEIHLLYGDGNFYWGGGMRLIFQIAKAKGYDYYLWLNEDTMTYKNAINTLLDTYYSLSSDSDLNLVVGPTLDNEEKNITYGGRLHSSWWQPLRFDKLVIPKGKPIECDTINGNCVLIPNAVAVRVGNIDKAFMHRRGDYDYGLRAKKMGCSLWVANDYIGTCDKSEDIFAGDADKSLKDGFEKIFSAKMMPYVEQKIYVKRHGGHLWWIILHGQYIKRGTILFIKHLFKSVKQWLI